MNKSRFIAGTVSLTMAVAVGTTVFGQISGYIGSKSLVLENETAGYDVIVEKSANEMNVLMDAGLNLDVKTVGLEIESSTNKIEKETKVSSKKNTSKKKEAKKAKAEETKAIIVIEDKNSKESLKKNAEAKVEKTEKATKKIEKSEKAIKASKTTTEKKTKKTKESDDNKKEYVGNYKVTAYCGCSHCCGKSNGITASGVKATAGRTVAADTSVLPFGTKLVINGHTYTVEDRGGAIRGNRIDVFFNSHQEALNWGVKYCDVYIQK